MLLRRRAVCLGLGTLPGLARAAAPAAPARRVLRLATGTEPQSADGRWLRDAYTLALEPLGYRLEAVELPALRAEQALDRAEIDGEMVRAAEYFEQRRDRLQVPFALIVHTVGLYAAQPLAGGPSALTDAVRRADAISYRQGVRVCEQRLARLTLIHRLRPEATTRSALASVFRGTSRLACEIDASAAGELQDLQAHGASRLVRVGSLGPAVPLFPCLTPRHRALAGDLLASFQRLEAEGRLEAGRLFRYPPHGA